MFYVWESTWSLLGKTCFNDLGFIILLLLKRRALYWLPTVFFRFQGLQIQITLIYLKVKNMSVIKKIAPQPISFCCYSHTPRRHFCLKHGFHIIRYRWLSSTTNKLISSKFLLFNPPASSGDSDKELSRPGSGLSPGMGRITGSASIETLVRVGIEKEHGLSPDSKMVVLHDFAPCVDDELEVCNVNFAAAKQHFTHCLTEIRILANKKEDYIMRHFIR